MKERKRKRGEERKDGAISLFSLASNTPLCLSQCLEEVGLSSLLNWHCTV